MCPLPVCAEHFEHSQFMNVKSKHRLVWSAVPTKFSMPNPPPQVSSKRPPPTWIKDWATTSNSTQQEIQEQSTNRLWFWYVILKKPLYWCGIPIKIKNIGIMSSDGVDAGKLFSKCCQQVSKSCLLVFSYATDQLQRTWYHLSQTQLWCKKKILWSVLFPWQ